MTRRVLLVSLSTVLGGAETSLLSLAAHLPAAGWEVRLACPEGEVARAATDLGLEPLVVAFTPAGVVSRRTGGRRSYSLIAVAELGRRVAADARRVRALVRREDPDVVYSNSLSSHLPVVAGARLAGRPVVAHLREIVDPGPGRWVLDRALRRARRVVAISAAVAGSVRHPAVHVVANPVAAPEPLPAALPWAMGRPRIGYLGRLDPRKGLETLLTAAGELPGHVVVAGRRWAGSPEYVEGLRALGERHAPGRVHFVGATAGPWAALRGLDVLVVPSENEPWGRVAAEAQVAGVPVVAAASGGLLEIVTDGVDGLLVPVGDAAALAAAVRKVIDGPDLARRLVSGGHRAGERFAPQHHAAAVAEVLERALVSGRASP